MMSAIEDLVIVRSARARRMRLSFDPQSGEVRLIVPQRAALAPALAWARNHEGWIAGQKSKAPEPWPIVSGMTIPFGGQDLVLDWSPSHPRNPKIKGSTLSVGGPEELLSQRLLRWLRREAGARLEAETRDLAMQHDILIGRVGVGDPQRRWGSCAPNGDIRYSWRLILAPEAVMRATVAHEVAHRLHMDHSPKFHAAVARLFGRDPAAERRWLKQHGARLHWFGRGS